MFRTLLIANRGEIAVRIIRACRDLDISPVVVYSEADRASLAVKLADQAHCIGPAPSSQSYLRFEGLLEAACKSGAEAVHPGYGFLAENSRFAAACHQAGLVFVGPSAESIRLMGDKIVSRKTVSRAGVPTVPGSESGLADAAEAIELAGSIGYPVMLKASAGGGGKGMRLVRSDRELREQFETTRGEAESAFGDATVFLEKYVPQPRHIEVQVLGDRHGNLIHLGERECSIQRRHQKVVEECPSPRVGPAFRQRLGEAAVAVAKSVDYVNAGTVEFLVDGSVEDELPPFYFLEMNTRLQVEHPVTEMVTGIDLVCEQIRVAAGERLQIEQEDVRWRGAAIECRVYAEDPFNSFFPCPGEIRELFEPSGPGIRNDSGVCAGFHIPVDYDPLISKLVAHGADRSQAIARMRRALREYKIAGVRTTIPFFDRLLAHPEFEKGRLHTNFIEQHQLGRFDEQAESTIAVAVAALNELLSTPEAPVQAAPRRSLWREFSRFRRRYGR